MLTSETPETQVVAPDRFHTGEGPVWDEVTGTLWWTSIEDGDIHSLGPDRRNPPISLGRPVGSFGLCESGRIVAARRDQVVLYDPTDGSIEILAEIPLPITEMRLNDGKVGPDGAFWVGSMDERSTKDTVAALFRVDPEGTVDRIVDGLMVSNGLAWSSDGKIMYHSDSKGPWIDTWSFDPATGEARDRARFADLDDETGRPDGGACDVEGCYWSAGPSAGVVNRFTPDGRILERYNCLNYRPTMPCFGGPDMRRLYVTSLSHSLPEDVLAKHPLCGRIISFEVKVAGAPVTRFRD